MEKYKTIFLITGLLCFIFGITSFIMTLVGVDWVFFQMLSKSSPFYAFLAKMVITMAGFVLLVMARTDWERERNESSEE